MDLSRITERGTHELEQKIKDLLPTGKPAPTLAADAQCPYFLVRRALGLLERAGIHSLAFTLEAGP
jgi:biopolymer transport protein ExbD